MIYQQEILFFKLYLAPLREILWYNSRYSKIKIKTPMRNFLTFILCLAVFFFSILSVHATDDDYFIVTAYYSPLPDQEFYLKGNYEAEIRLNWRWIAWASGRGVFSGMLAAPKKYSFWTKIYLEWLGIGSVEDRWWAIVPAGQRGYSHDRIDVWVWYGDEGLKRALYWWKRKVKWHVVNSKSVVSMNTMGISAPDWAVKGLKKPTPTVVKKVILKHKQSRDLFSFAPTSSTHRKEVQKIFVELWLYDGEIDWDNDIFIDTIYDFQVSQGILTSPYSPWAGYFWPKTREALKNEYIAHKEEEKRRQELIKLYTELEMEALESARNSVEQIWYLKWWEVSPRVRILQKKLQKLWFFQAKDTAIFGDVTKEALISYQLENHIISSSDSLWAGIFGPKTKQAMIEDFSNIFLEEEITVHISETDYKFLDISL